MYVFHTQIDIDFFMELNKSKGRWWNAETYPNFNKPTIEDDLAYHYYCESKPSKKCIPQMTFTHITNRNHIEIKPFYDKVQRGIKLNKIKEKINETRKKLSN